MNEPFKTLINAAVLAPSGDNTQPWKFEVDENSSAITILVDETRDTSPMNTGQSMARACGAAIENMERTAKFNGWRFSTEWHGDAVRIATLQLSGDFSYSGAIEETIRERHTNRRLYDGSRLCKSVVEELIHSVIPAHATSIQWINDEKMLGKYASLIGGADALMFGEPAFFRAFLSNVRFDRPPLEVVTEGLSIGSLELTKLERRIMRFLRSAPAWTLRSWPLEGAFKKKARDLVESASGLCFIRKLSRSPIVDASIGRTMDRAWLGLTKLGFVAQPMMSFPVLNNSVQHHYRHGAFFENVAQLASEFAAMDTDATPQPPFCVLGTLISRRAASVGVATKRHALLDHGLRPNRFARSEVANALV